MNGELVHGRTEPNPFMNSSSRIAGLAKDPAKAVEMAFLSVLVRPPEKEEKKYFVEQIKGTKGDQRQKALHDLFWVLMNSTEFSWNR